MSKLEKTTHVFVILLCAAGLLTIVNQYLRRPLLPEVKAAEFIGKPLTVPGVKWDQPVSIVVAVKATCPYCLASMPMYKKLAELQQQQSPMRLVFVSEDDATTIQQILSAFEVKGASVISTSFSKLGVTSTPTLFAVDSNGIIRQAFVGKMKEQYKDVLVDLVSHGRAM